MSKLKTLGPRLLCLILLTPLILVSACGSGNLSAAEKQNNFETCKSKYLSYFPGPGLDKKKQAEEECSPLRTAEQNEVDLFIGPSPWICEDGNDGLGKTLRCSSWSQDTRAKWWFLLSLYCSSDGSPGGGIMGLDPNANNRSIFWKYSDKTLAKVRIDQNPSEDWRYFVKGYDEGALEKGGEFLFFYQEGKTPLAEATGKGVTKMAENAARKLLIRLENAQTFGFQAFDVDENMTATVFNVDNQLLPISRFREMGCLN